MDQEDHPQNPGRRAVLRASAASGMLFAVRPAPAQAASGPSGPSPAPNAAPAAVPLRPLSLRINGAEHAVQLDVRTTLLDALRNQLGMTGTKKGCDHGQCGACTVLVNGRRINACLTLAVMHDGDAITTIEGLADGDALHPVQSAFIARDAFQCGYCTPGQICSAVGMLAEVRAGWPSHASRDVAARAFALDEAEIRERMSGNLCRCAAYPNIVAAIRDAADGGKA
ncbi:2Fe-2S iron-sulfur cluster-binding protein [Cupriavidus taiwanensis]|uniref:Oxidoreductase, 2Fe-2S subunit n=1 Tax=Cupriavidus taiwanensis TaxID=164546 RepID=A0A375BHI2_9BURK|nr:2Fe-2S iron-sulfur cluster-binding protein [Cupriavidus taiwanensis]NSX13860.1 2Fe-2S iron-sulfur cluster binding domain-containing protein [Cupriavidus taiwanensis]SOY45498.1 putative oxidoreductase, 2Fe-2S subunit [Cupriavidus taiwanensis]